MKKLILCLILLLLSSGIMNAESWFENFKRVKYMFGYENIKIEEKFLFNGYEVPNRQASLTLRTFSVNLGVYLPVYEIANYLSVGISPQISFISGGVTQTTNNDTWGNSSTSGEGGFSISAFKFAGSLDLKYGADASLKKETSKLGVGIGVGYFYDLFVAVLDYDYHTPMMKAEAVYMFKDFLGLALNGFFPFTAKKAKGDFEVYGYSVSFGLVGSFGSSSSGRRRR